MAGLPAFLIALPLNYFFVEIIQLEKEFSYFLIMVLQVLINFLLSIKLVFFETVGYSLYNFSVFLSVVLFVRFFDWYLYGILINNFNVYFIIIQILNVAFFSYLKFVALEKFYRAK